MLIKKDDKVFCVRLLNEVLDMICDEGNLKKSIYLDLVKEKMEKKDRYCFS